MSGSSIFKWIFSLIFTLIAAFIVMPLVLVGIFIVLAGQVEKEGGTGLNKIAVIELEGVIETSRDVVSELYKQVHSDKVDGIILSINSPGGAVGPSQEIYNAVRKLKDVKPIVAVMSGVAASGGLYAALPATKIFAQPGTLTGSIGVILQLPNYKDIAEKVGFKMHTVKSGALKDVGNPFRELNSNDEEFLQSTVQVAYEDFINSVATSRNLDINKVREFADGRIILGSQAIQLGLVDSIGGVYEASNEIYTILGEKVDEKDITLVYPLDKLKYVRKFFQTFSWIQGISAGTMSLRFQ